MSPDAIRHSSLGFVRLYDKTPHDMFVDVTIGVPNPEAVDTAAVQKADYEAEIRSSFKARLGEEAYRRIFPPEHTQSRVLRRYRS